MFAKYSHGLCTFSGKIISLHTPPRTRALKKWIYFSEEEIVVGLCPPRISAPHCEIRRGKLELLLRIIGYGRVAGYIHVPMLIHVYTNAVPTARCMMRVLNSVPKYSFRYCCFCAATVPIPVEKRERRHLCRLPPTRPPPEKCLRVWRAW